MRVAVGLAFVVSCYQARTLVGDATADSPGAGPDSGGDAGIACTPAMFAASGGLLATATAASTVPASHEFALVQSLNNSVGLVTPLTSQQPTTSIANLDAAVRPALIPDGTAVFALDASGTPVVSKNANGDHTSWSQPANVTGLPVGGKLGTIGLASDGLFHMIVPLDSGHILELVTTGVDQAWMTRQPKTTPYPVEDPSLTPDALGMVFYTPGPVAGADGVYFVQRGSTDDDFVFPSAPAGRIQHIGIQLVTPVLSADCTTLYGIVENQLIAYH